MEIADDFKIVCRSEEDARKMFIVTKDWLDKRLGLEVSEEKSKIVNLKKSCSEFLGFKLWAKAKKKDKWVAYIAMADKAKKSCKDGLRKAIKEIQ